MRRVIILGSTGSIGRQTLGVISHLNALSERGEHEHRFEVVGLAAGKNVALLAEQSAMFPEARLAIAHADVRDLALDEQGRGATFPGRLLNAIHGEDAALSLIREVSCDVVVAAMVGSAGLPATLAAVELGRHVALANKETLVAAGGLVVPAATRSGARLLPVDSEHSAVWQCLAPSVAPPCVCGPEVTRVVLTASGGAFRDWPLERIEHATPQEALNHPTWSMGPKVTVDSASLTNKAFELLEAHWLFGLGGERLGVVIHPQSIVHAFVEHADGSVIAQLARPDMRLPIQFALTHPARAPGSWPRLDWSSASRLEFAPPDPERFPALGLAQEVLRGGEGSALGAVFNAANEAAVEAFLAPESRVRFGFISKVVGETMKEFAGARARTLVEVLEVDAAARRAAKRRLGLAGAGRFSSAAEGKELM